MPENNLKKAGLPVRAVAAIIAVATVALYLTALANGFVDWDDNGYIVENHHIRSFSPAFFKWAFLNVYASNWHPLAWISHALDYALWGLNPAGHHLTSVILHGLNTFLVVVFSFRLFESGSAWTCADEAGPIRKERMILTAAVVTGLLFGIHPLHVESVAWAAERKDVLCAVFFLLSMITYLSYAGVEAAKHSFTGFSNKYFSSALLFFVLALLSKPMAVTLPVVLVVLDWFPLGRVRSWSTLRSSCFEKIPFIALSLASSIVTVMAQRAGNALVTADFIPPGARLLVAARSLFAYLCNMVLPLHLVPFYPYPKNISSAPAPFLFSVVGALVLTAILILAAKKRPALLAAWVSYAMILIPVLGIVQVGGQAMADRYTYLPSIAPFLAVGVSLGWASEKLRAKRQLFVRNMSAIAVAAAFAILAVLTLRQISIWKSSIDLWSYTLQEYPQGVPLANNQLGIAYVKKGLFEKAVSEFDKAIAVNPSYPEAYNNRGMALNAMGLSDRALADYDRAIALYPSYTEAYNNRGMVLDARAEFDKAIADYDRAIALNPAYYKAYNNQGISYSKARAFEAAIACFTKAIDLNPAFADAYFNRGITLAFTGRFDQALADLDQAIRFNEAFTAAYHIRGNLYVRTGNARLAARDFQKACSLGDQNACSALLQPARMFGKD